MKLKFKTQEYQLKAVDSICDIFDGQPKKNYIEILSDYDKNVFYLL